MKSKTIGTLFGLLSLIVILGTASEITTLTASAQSVLPGRHCTANQPCVQVCGDHVCAPGELAQLKAQSSQQSGNNSETSATHSTSMSTPSTGVIIAGIVSYMDEGPDGTAVIVRTGHPISGQPLAIGIGFKDVNNNFVQHQNYAITVTQDGKTVFSNTAGHTHTGTDSITTNNLSSNTPVDIAVTLNGVGLPTADPSTWMGVKGEVLTFSQATDLQTPATSISNMIITTSNATVPEFGPVASIVLAIAVLSMVVFAAKTRVIPRL